MNRKPRPEMLQRLAYNLKKLRDARGWTPRELADRCGLHRTYISNVEDERLNITVANLDAIASGLECTATDLLMQIPES